MKFYGTLITTHTSTTHQLVEMDNIEECIKGLLLTIPDVIEIYRDDKRVIFERPAGLLPVGLVIITQEA